MCPYIYKITNTETGKYYIGSQCSGKIIGVNYFTSSTNKEFKNDFKLHHKEKYDIQILATFLDSKECITKENELIRDAILLNDGLCLNRHYISNNKNVFSNCKQIVIDGVLYESIADAARELNVRPNTIWSWYKNKKFQVYYPD